MASLMSNLSNSHEINNPKVYKMKYLLYGAIVCVAFSACDLKQKETRNALEEMSKSKVDIPFSKMGCFHSDADTLRIVSIAEQRYTFVHYVDSSQCSPCALDRMYTWNKFVDEYSKKGVRFAFIVEPKIEQMEDVHFSIASSGLHSPIYVDSLFAFRKQNKNLPTEQKYHSFLLDKLGHVILVGNPVQNSKIEELLDKIINNKK